MCWRNFLVHNGMSHSFMMVNWEEMKEEGEEEQNSTIYAYILGDI